jgi:hypothetical protein
MPVARSCVSSLRGAATALVLLVGALAAASCSDDDKDQSRDCCRCLWDHECWDVQKCPTNEDCVCSLLGSQCQNKTPCFAVSEECRKQWCDECDSLFR